MADQCLMCCGTRGLRGGLSFVRLYGLPESVSSDELNGGSERLYLCWFGWSGV